MENTAKTIGRKQVVIEFLYSDLSVCTRCRETDRNLEEAISEVVQVLRATGVNVRVKKIHVQSEKQAQALKFVSSPTIRINGKDIQFELKESLCDSCGDLCGEDVLCRVWIYQGKEYTAAPKPMIIEAILRAVYGETAKTAEELPQKAIIPDNLKRFFSAKRQKEASEHQSQDRPSTSDCGCQNNTPAKKCC